MSLKNTLYIHKLYARRYKRKDITMAPHVSGNYGSRSHVSKTQSTWAKLKKARMNEENNKTKKIPPFISLVRYYTTTL